METLLQRIRELADDITSTNLSINNTFKVVKSEKNDSIDYNPEAATFLKLNGIRLGRDFEQYAFLKEIIGIDEVIVMLFEEVVLPLEEILPGAFNDGIYTLKDMALSKMIGMLR